MARDPTVGLPKGLRADRVPGTLDEARKMVAYNESILATTASGQRRLRAAAMLVNLRPHVERLKAEEAARCRRIESSTPPASTIDGQLQRMRDAKRDEPEFETVWDGAMGKQGKSIASW